VRWGGDEAAMTRSGEVLGAWHHGGFLYDAEKIVKKTGLLQSWAGGNLD
jgi:hypothetical protein